MSEEGELYYMGNRNITKFHRAVRRGRGFWILKIRPLYTFTLTAVPHADGDGDSFRGIITDGGEE